MRRRNHRYAQTFWSERNKWRCLFLQTRQTLQITVLNSCMVLIISPLTSVWTWKASEHLLFLFLLGNLWKIHFLFYQSPSRPDAAADLWSLLEQQSSSVSWFLSNVSWILQPPHNDTAVSEIIDLVNSILIRLHPLHFHLCWEEPRWAAKMWGASLAEWKNTHRC